MENRLIRSEPVLNRATNVTFYVLAGKKLSGEQAAAAVKVYLQMTPKKKWPKRNTTCEIVTTLTGDEGFLR